MTSLPPHIGQKGPGLSTSNIAIAMPNASPLITAVSVNNLRIQLLYPLKICLANRLKYRTGLIQIWNTIKDNY